MYAIRVCARTDCRTHRYRIYSVLSSFRASSTRDLRGPACVLPLTAHVSTRSCDVASGWVTAGSTSWKSRTCSEQRITTFSVASSRTEQSSRPIQPYLPDDNEIPYQLRARSHTLALINARSQAVARIVDRTAPQ